MLDWENMVPSKKKVLVADDEPGILRVLGIKLRLAGYEVMTALSGREALELLESSLPDIMLLDIIMPDTDGFQVLEKLRATSALPVIAFSARPDNAKKALELGANDFVAKPFDVEDVARRIKKILVSRS
jgi:DNA-binding response OmpR family regulator